MAVKYQGNSNEFKVIAKAVEENQDKLTIDIKPSDTNKLNLNMASFLVMISLFIYWYVIMEKHKKLVIQD